MLLQPLKNKTSLVIGIANDFSIAHSVARRIRDNGGDVIATYMDDKFSRKVRECTKDMGIKEYIHYNAMDPECMEGFIEGIKKACPNGIDHIVHAIARAERADLSGEYFNVNQENFTTAMHVSCYSLTQVSRCLFPLLNDGGSIVTFSYSGAQRTAPNYNVMGVCKAALEASVRYLAWDCGKRGIRVNAISAGPIKTLAATGIKDFQEIVEASKRFSPLKRSVTLDDISGTALFLLMNELSSGITGQVIYVDCGVNSVGLPTD